MTAIRKYSNHLLFKNIIAKHKLSYEYEGWQKYLPQKFVAQVNYYLKKVQPPLFGQSLSCDYTLSDVLHVANMWEVSAREVCDSSKLKHTPVFYLERNNCSHNGTTRRIYTGSTRDLLNGYEKAEHLHKILETHHPDSKSFVNDNFTSAEVVFDVFSSLLRSHTLSMAYSKLIMILGTQKFAKLNPEGVLVALMHLVIRGVANSEVIYASSRWRYTKDRDTLRSYNRAFKLGNPPPIEISNYKMETWLHAEAVRAEMKRLRSPKVHLRHDHSKFHSDLLYYYTWYWGTWTQMTEIEQQRALAEVTDDWLERQGVPTMFTSPAKAVAAAVTEGLTNTSPELERVLGDSTLNLTQNLSSMFDEKIESFHEMFSGLSAQATEQGMEKIRVLMDEFFQKAHNLSDDFTSGFGNRASEAFAGLVGMGSEFNQILQNFQTMIASAISKFTEQFMRPLGISDMIKIDPIRVFLGFQYLVMLLNVESQIMKTFFLCMFLHNFGLLRVGWEIIQNVYHHFCPRVEIYGEEIPGETTFDASGLMNFLFSSSTNLLLTISSIFISTLHGTKLMTHHLNSLLTLVAGVSKNFHFIGGGILGIQRTIEACRLLWSKLTDWYTLNILGQTPETKLLAQKIMRWCLLVRYFSTEPGMNAIRFSRKMFDVADHLFSEGQELLARVSTGGPDQNRDFMMQLQRYSRQISTIASFISRIRSTSSFQPTMFHIQFNGPPGIGKSTLTKMLVNDLLETLYDGDHTNAYWSYNPSLDHFDGYSGQKIMLVDDLFRYNDPKHLTTLLTLITNVPVILPMANLEDKGVQLSSDIMISSTNTAYPVGKDVFCMNAVHRRRHMLVEVSMDPVVMDPSSQSFSQTLYEKSGKFKNLDIKGLPHLTFDLLKPVLAPGQTGGYVTIGDDEWKEYAALSSEIEEINRDAVNPGKSSKLNPKCYYSEENPPPSPINLPATGWTYRELLNNIVLRYRLFRSAESSYSREKRYAHTMSSLNDIDEHIFSQTEQPKGLLSQYFYELEQPVPLEIPEGGIFVAPSIESEANLLSEFEDLDVEAIVSDIINDSNAVGLETMNAEPSTSRDPNVTFQPLTLMEEAKRSREIRRKKNFVERDLIIDNILKAKRRHELFPDEVDRSKRFYQYVPITHGATTWANIHVHSHGTSRVHRMMSVAELNQYLAERILPDPPPMAEYDESAHRAWVYEVFENTEELRSFLRQFNLSALAKYPGSFPPEIAKQESAIPWYFLKNLEFVAGNWHFVLKRGLVNERKREIEVTPHDSRRTITLEPDSAFILSIYQPFMVACTEFCSLSPSAQREMVELAKWREQYTGFYNLQGMSRALKELWIPLRDASNQVMRAIDFRAYITGRFKNIIAGLLASAVCILSFLAIRKMCSLFTTKLTGSETSRVLHRSAKTGVVYKGTFTSLNQNSNFSSFVDSFAVRNLRFIQIETEDGVVGAQGIVTGQYLIVPKHLLRPVAKHAVFILKMHLPTQPHPLHVYIEKEQIVEYDQGDLALIHSTSFPVARNIEPFLFTSRQLENVEMVDDTSILSRYEGECHVERYVRGKRARKIRMTSEDGTSCSILDSIIIDGNTMVGKSGSPVFSPFKALSAQYLLGIQAWQVFGRAGNQICVQVLTRDILENMQSQLEALNGCVSIKRESEYPLEQTTSSLKGLFTSEVVVCEVPKTESVGIIGNTQFRRSPIAHMMDAAHKGSVSVPAASSQFDKRLINGPKLHPIAHSLNKYVRGQVQPFNPVILRKIREDFVLYLSGELDQKYYRTLNFEEAITGTRQDGSNPMDLSTSPGIPYVFQTGKEKGKKTWLNINENGELDWVDPNFKDEYDLFEQSMFSGTIPLNRSYDFPKDELRPADKALGTASSPPKTRTVTCMNMKYIILWRKLTLDFWAAQHRKAGSEFPLCPGMNPEGPDWSNMYRALRKHPNYFDFDVSNWDGFMPPDLLFLAGDIVADVMGYGHSSRQRTAIRAILADVLFGYVQFGTLVYQKNRGMISGFPGTAEMNSLVHFILIYYVYLDLAPQVKPTMNTFLSQTQVYVYGDDIICSFSTEIEEWFNGVTVSQQYEAKGYPVTSSDKLSAIRKTKPFAECQFLKSTWRKLEHGIWIRKLDLDVATNLLYWTRAKQHPLEQFYSNLSDALFIWFGHGEEVYKQNLAQLNEWLREAKMPLIYITYRDQLADYTARYYSME